MFAAIDTLTGEVLCISTRHGATLYAIFYRYAWSHERAAIVVDKMTGKVVYE